MKGRKLTPVGWAGLAAAAAVLSGAAGLGTPAAAARAVGAAHQCAPQTAYVSNLDSGTVTPIKTGTNTAGPAITVGQDPYAIAITPNGKTAYVENMGSGTVTPISTCTNTAGPAITVGQNPYTIVITPNGKTAYVAN
jgi:YVTN family beta-propeller protein